MKVKIMQRSVYHKYAEIEVEVPEIHDYNNIQEYLLDNEDLYVDKIDKAIGEANLEYGSGVHDYGGMTDELAESEWRFDIVGKNYGGHL